ncbi:MAG: molybdopterin-binding oxidoreductase [Sphingobacteriales bacterium]|nr:MAG: molybdopterin-binding oxidoreductase [Sphingobacteriales bacterium]
MKPHPEQRKVDPKAWRRRSAFSFTAFILLLACAVFVFRWIKQQPRVDGAPRPLRAALNANEKVFGSYFDTSRQARTYPLTAAVRKVRVNGNDGLRTQLDTAAWRLQVVRSAGDTLRITMDEIRALPKKDIVFDFKCIEGWSQVTHWAGVPLKTFLERYGLKAEEGYKYMGLVTPDGGYYVGIDMPSALHPQTLLCYEMNGKPLPLNQGYPLRLIIPVKYGVKHLKRIGTMSFSNQKPPDYWAERGYDYYTGH